MVAQTRARERARWVRTPGVDGVRVLRGKLSIADADVARLRDLALRGAPIFNPDERRVQHVVPATDPTLQSLVAALEAEGLLDGRTVGPAVALHSSAGCAQQAFHTDYEPKRVAAAAGAKPLGVLAALEAGTRFVTPERTYELAPGDIVVFDGDAVHAGAAYASPNTRLHLYVDSPAVHRAPNTTYLLEDAAA